MPYVPWTDAERDLLREFIHHSHAGGLAQGDKPLTWKQIVSKMQEEAPRRVGSTRLYTLNKLYSHWLHHIAPDYTAADDVNAAAGGVNAAVNVPAPILAPLLPESLKNALQYPSQVIEPPLEVKEPRCEEQYTIPSGPPRDIGEYRTAG